MASTKISALPAASTLTGAETIPLVQGGVTKKVTTDQFLTAANPSYTGTLTGGTGVVNIGAGQVVKDASGNLGLGVTPSAWGGGLAFDLNTFAAVSTRGADSGVDLIRNAYFNGTNWIYKLGSNAQRFTQDNSGAFKWFNAPVGTAGNPISFTQAMTLDSSGRLQLGAATVDAFDMARLSGTNAIANDLSLHGPSTSQVRLQFSRTGAYGRGEIGYNMATDTLRFVVSGSQAMTLDAAGNLGVGVTPGAWNWSSDAIQVGLCSSFYANGNTATAEIGCNVRQSAASTWNYIVNASGASRYVQNFGSHEWFTAPSGTAGNPISFTQAMTLDASGNLLVGTTTGSNRLTVNSGAVTTIAQFTTTGSAAYLAIKNSGATAFIGADNTGALLLQTPGSGFSTKLKVTDTGNLIQTVNTTAATLSTNGTLTFSLVSDTSLRVSVRGSDGVTRTATLTLA